MRSPRAQSFITTSSTLCFFFSIFNGFALPAPTRRSPVKSDLSRPCDPWFCACQTSLSLETGSFAVASVADWPLRSRHLDSTSVSTYESTRLFRVVDPGRTRIALESPSSSSPLSVADSLSRQCLPLAHSAFRGLPAIGWLAMKHFEQLERISGARSSALKPQGW